MVLTEQFDKMQEKKFIQWVSQYIQINGSISPFHLCDYIAFLVVKKVFTFEEIRAELLKEGISLHEEHFKKARYMVNNGAHPW